MSGPTLVGNDWSALRPAHDHGPMPAIRVTVCIPCRDPGEGLARVLDALRVQTYPRELIEVVVADDGSAVPVQVTSTDLPVSVVRVQDPLPFGAGRARNVAAAAATGDVLVFLDADVVPERQVVETYARWFTERDDVLVTGLCRFADMGNLTDEALQALVADGTLERTFAGREVDDQAWREKTFERTDDLRTEALDAFRIVIGATLAVSARQLAAGGGFRELGIRGIEDIELGYRVHADGAVLVLDRDARHWHQGRRSLSDERKQQVMAARAPYAERLLPLRSFRTEPPEPRDVPLPTVPRLVVHCAPGAERPVAPADYLVLDGDAEPEPLDAVPFVPALGHVWVPAGARLSAASLPALLRALKADVGVVVVEGPDGEQVVAARTRALRRARREDPDGDLVAAMTARFGARRLPSERVEISWAGPRRSERRRRWWRR